VKCKFNFRVSQYFQKEECTEKLASFQVFGDLRLVNYVGKG